MWNQNLAVAFGNVLSMCVILVCCISKIPQIHTVIKHKSAKGLSITSIYLEAIRYAVMWCYNYCFGYSLLSYFEYPILFIQQCVLTYCALKCSHLLGTKSFAWAFISALTILFFLTGILPRAWLLLLIPLCTPIGIFSRTTQFLKIFHTKNSKNINLLTWFFAVFTSSARVYTIVVESNDRLLLINSVSSVLTSSLVLASAIYYRKSIQD